MYKVIPILFFTNQKENFSECIIGTPCWLRTFFSQSWRWHGGRNDAYSTLGSDDAHCGKSWSCAFSKLNDTAIYDCIAYPLIEEAITTIQLLLESSRGMLKLWNIGGSRGGGNEGCNLESQWGSEECKKEARAEVLSKIPEAPNFHT